MGPQNAAWRRSRQECRSMLFLPRHRRGDGASRRHKKVNLFIKKQYYNGKRARHEGRALLVCRRCSWRVKAALCQGRAEKADEGQQGEVGGVEGVAKALEVPPGISLLPGIGQGHQHSQVVSAHIQKAVLDGSGGEVLQYPLDQSPAGEDRRRQNQSARCRRGRSRVR